jgi:hypothetical protein
VVVVVTSWSRSARCRGASHTNSIDGARLKKRGSGGAASAPKLSLSRHSPPLARSSPRRSPCSSSACVHRRRRSCDLRTPGAEMASLLRACVRVRACLVARRNLPRHTQSRHNQCGCCLVGQKLAATAVKLSSRFVASCSRGFRRHNCDDGMCGVAASGRHPNTPLVCYNSPNGNMD